MSNFDRRNTVARYSVTAVPDPSIMSRVLELFTKRNLIPDHFAGSLVAGNVSGTETRLEITVEIAGLDDHLAGYLGRCMQQITYVLSVEVSDEVSAGRELQAA